MPNLFTSRVSLRQIVWNFDNLWNILHILGLPSQTAFSVTHFCAQAVFYLTAKNTLFTRRIRYFLTNFLYRRCPNASNYTYIYQKIFQPMRARTPRRHLPSVNFFYTPCIYTKRWDSINLVYFDHKILFTKNLFCVTSRTCHTHQVNLNVVLNL